MSYMKRSYEDVLEAVDWRMSDVRISILTGIPIDQIRDAREVYTIWQDNENDNEPIYSSFIDLLIEYTKVQMKVLEDNPSMSTGTFHYKLKKTIEYLEQKKLENNYISQT